MASYFYLYTWCILPPAVSTDVVSAHTASDLDDRVSQIYSLPRFTHIDVLSPGLDRSECAVHAQDYETTLTAAHAIE